MKKLMIILTLSILTLAATPALAGYGKKHHGHAHQMLKHADANKDGKVSKAEFMNAAKKHAKKVFSHMDANKDGVLDKKDHASYFDKLDADHNGQISRKEFESFHKKMRKHHQNQGGHHG